MGKHGRLMGTIKSDAVALAVDRDHAVGKGLNGSGSAPNRCAPEKCSLRSCRANGRGGAKPATGDQTAQTISRSRNQETRYFRKGNRRYRACLSVRYAFQSAHQPALSVRAVCRIVMGHVSGADVWLKAPLSHAAQEDVRQAGLIPQAWSDRGKGCDDQRALGRTIAISLRCKLLDDLRDQGEQGLCGQKPVLRQSRNVDRQGKQAAGQAVAGRRDDAGGGDEQGFQIRSAKGAGGDILHRHLDHAVD